MRAILKVLICCATATVLITGCTSTTTQGRESRIPGLTPNAPTYTHLISISQDQLVSFKGQTLDLATLDQELSREGVSKTDGIMVKVHPSTPYQGVMKVLEQLRSGGYTNLSLTTSE